MNTELVDVSETKKEIRIEIAPDEVRKAFDLVSKKFAEKAEVPGFRKGMAPLDVIRMRYEKEIRSDVLQDLLPAQVEVAIREHDLQPISEPQLHLDDAENVKVNGSQPLNVHVHVEIMPVVPVPEYEGMGATRRVRPVSEEEIEGVIDERRQQHSTMIPVENRKSEDGDVVIVDLKGTFLDEEGADPIEVNDLEVNLGDGLVEKSFTDNLVDVQEDDEREFEVEYPEDFSSTALAGRKVKYHAKVKSVGNIEIPDADDEWVTSLDEGFQSLEELKSGLRKDLESISKAEADSQVRNELIGKLIEKHEFEVPAALIDSQAQTLLNNFAQDLSQRGVDLSKVEKEFIENTYEQMKVQAQRDVRGAMLLEKIAESESVDVSDDEVGVEIKQMATHYQVTEDKIIESLEEQGGRSMIANNLRTRKAVEALVSKAEVADAEWIAESAENNKPEEKPDEHESGQIDEKEDKKNTAA